MDLLLDTCALLWLSSDWRKFSDAALAAVSSAQNPLHVSAISAFEIGLLVRKKRITLETDVAAWFASICELYDVRVLDISWQVALRAAAGLPAVHDDPFDRIIVASALEHRLTVITPDQKIAAYEGVSVTW